MDKSKDRCSFLTFYASKVRYPNLLKIESYHMKKAIEDVKVISEYVLTSITGLSK